MDAKENMKPPLWVCHQLPERSIKYRGKTIPLCTRCLGLYSALVIGVIISYLFNFTEKIFWGQLVFLSIILVIPLALDGITQAIRIRKSNNKLRLTTGVLTGLILGLDLHHIMIRIIN